MYKKLSLISITFILATIGCASTKPVTFETRKGINTATKKVVTMAVYDMSTSSVGATDDESNKTFSSIAQVEVGNIYSSMIPGGEATLKVAESLKLKGDFDKAMKNATEAIVNQGSVDPKTVEVFTKLAGKIGVDALAFPLVSGNKLGLTQAPGLTYRFALYDVKDGTVQYVAQVEGVTVNGTLYEKADDNQKKVLISTATTQAVNAIFTKVKEELAKAANPPAK